MTKRSIAAPLRIGLSACFFHADPQRAVFKGKTLQYAEQSMARWIQNAGGLVYLIPGPAERAPITLAHYAEDLDGLVLQGGSDVSPLSYGEEPLKPEWAGDKIRDDYEIALVAEFMRLSKPVLGICRGLQLINVAFGGTLYQDINHFLPQAFKHRNWEIYDSNYHQIEIEKDSRLSAWYGQLKSAKINSVHHQAIKDLGKNLIVESRSRADGIIEAVRLEGGPWVYAVQWHPEYQEGHEGLLNSQVLIDVFLTEVEKRKSGRV